MLFNGGMVPTYLIYTQLFHIRNSILALIVPNLLFNGFQMMIMRTFFAASIPEELTEAARMDGAGEIRIFLSVVLGLAKPVFVTVGLMQAVAYWNDWWNAIMLVDDKKLYPLQYLLLQLKSQIQMIKDMQEMTGRSIPGQKAPSESLKMATSIITIGPIVLLYPFLQKYFVKGLVVGAVKG